MLEKKGKIHFRGKEQMLEFLSQFYQSVSHNLVVPFQGLGPREVLFLKRKLLVSLLLRNTEGREVKRNEVDCDVKYFMVGSAVMSSFDQHFVAARGQFS